MYIRILFIFEYVISLTFNLSNLKTFTKTLAFEKKSTERQMIVSVIDVNSIRFNGVKCFSNSNLHYHFQQ